MRINLEDGLVTGMILRGSNRWGVDIRTLTATTAVGANAPHVLAWDPGGGARTVTLPASPKKGDWFLLINTADAAEIITVQDSAAAALVPPITPTQNESALLVYISATLGWRGFVSIGV